MFVLLTQLSQDFRVVTGSYSVQTKSVEQVSKLMGNLMPKVLILLSSFHI